jgi:hypothetical protein
MNGFMDDPLISSLLNQPIIIWSLVISASIFVIALLLSAVFKLRNGFKLRQAEKLAAETKAKEAEDAAKELIAEKHADLSQLKIDEQTTAEDNSINSGEIGGLAVQTAVAGKESDAPAQFVEVAGTDEGKENADSSESDEAKSALADIFQNEIIVDPLIQAMRDNLPAIEMSTLLKEIQLVNTQLREREKQTTN